MKLFSFFLPQFHQTFHNNKWWGDGFTEWTLVKNAKKMYEEHRQPRIPYGGYYNLVDSNEIELQAKKAKTHGIDGFVLYDYWYEGERILDQPLELILKNKNWDIGFSLCWANHSWTRSWKNRKGAADVLIDQTYESTSQDRQMYFKHIVRVFEDSRCNRINGQPIFHIYKPADIPELNVFIDELRNFVKKSTNEDVHISAIMTDWKKDKSFLNLFDSITMSQPALALYAPENILVGKLTKSSNYTKSIIRSSPLWLQKIFYTAQDKLIKDRIRLCNYDDIWKMILTQTKETQQSAPLKVFPSGFVDFDNTARYKNRALIMSEFTPEKFESYMYQLFATNREQVTFLYAWNEWSEGMYMEADMRYGNARLECLANAKNQYIRSLKDT